MYNENLKNEFISFKQNTTLPQSYLQREFGKCSSVEEYANKDISNFSTTEIMDYYKSLGFRSLDTLIVLNSMFSQYTNFCIIKDLVKDKQNHFLEINNEYLINCVNHQALENRYIDEQTLVKWCEQLLNDSDKFIIRCLYEGICGECFLDIYYASLNNFNTEHWTMFTPYTKRIVKISPTLYTYAENSNDCLESYSYISSKTRKLKETNRIIKISQQSKDNGDSKNIHALIYHRLCKSLKYLGVQHYITANCIMDSGIVNMFNTIAKEKGISGKDALYDNDIKKQVEEHYMKNKIVRSTFLLKYGKYLVD